MVRKRINLQQFVYPTMRKVNICQKTQIYMKKLKPLNINGTEMRIIFVFRYKKAAYTKVHTARILL